MDGRWYRRHGAEASGHGEFEGIKSAASEWGPGTQTNA